MSQSLYRNIQSVASAYILNEEGLEPEVQIRHPLIIVHAEQTVNSEPHKMLI